MSNMRQQYIYIGYIATMEKPAWIKFTWEERNYLTLKNITRNIHAWIKLIETVHVLNNSIRLLGKIDETFFTDQCRSCRRSGKESI